MSTYAVNMLYALWWEKLFFLLMLVTNPAQCGIISNITGGFTLEIKWFKKNMANLSVCLQPVWSSDCTFLTLSDFFVAMSPSSQIWEIGFWSGQLYWNNSRNYKCRIHIVIINSIFPAKLFNFHSVSFPFTNKIFWPACPLIQHVNRQWWLVSFTCFGSLCSQAGFDVQLWGCCFERLHHKWIGLLFCVRLACIVIKQAERGQFPFDFRRKNSHPRSAGSQFGASHSEPGIRIYTALNLPGWNINTDSTKPGTLSTDAYEHGWHPQAVCRCSHRQLIKVVFHPALLFSSL